jgi:hypothetical protein
MFNHFVIPLLERIHGTKLAVLLGKYSGTTERTWRTRMKKGWEPTEDELQRFRERADKKLAKDLVELGEWTLEEALDIVKGRPSAKFRTPLLTADLIYYFSPLHGQYCQEAIALATHFDQDCARLYDAVRAGDTDQVRQVLNAMLDWLLTFAPADQDTLEVQDMRTQFCASADVDTLLHAAKPLAESLLLHMISCWDVEFCAGYFGETMQAYPLFELVMPCFAPDIDIEAGTGRLLRNGRQPRKKVIDTATSRLLDFLAVIVAWKRRRRLPANIPRVKEFAAWSEQDEAGLVSWRDETTRFTAKQIEDIWIKAIKADKKGYRPAIPFPMFVCAHLWRPLFAREGGRTIHLIDCAAGYRIWWERNRERLVARGLRFGTQAWPSCLTVQRPDFESLSAARSRQSSGRLSQPRDCQ